MYSENDFRNYSELYHKDSKWNWLPGGKNTSEYNHWYYMTHPEKWGITKAAQAAGQKLNEMAKNTDTDLDDKFLDAAGNLINKGKNAVANNSVVQDVRRSTEALQRRDNAKRNANEYAKQATNYQQMAQQSRREAAQQAWEGNRPGMIANRRGAESNASQASSSNTKAQAYRRLSNEANDEAKSYRDRAVNTVTEGVKNAPKNIAKAVNSAINKSDTLADNFARDAVRSLGRGDFKNAANFAGQAAKTAGRDLKSAAGRAGDKVVNRVNDTINKSDTLADNFARDAVRSLRRGDVKNAINFTGQAAKTAGRDLKSAAGRAGESIRGAAKGAGDKVVNRVNDTINKSDTLADNFARDAVRSLRRGDFKNAANFAGQATKTAGRDLKSAAGDTYGKAKDFVGDLVDDVRDTSRRIADATGLTARRETQRAQENADRLSDQPNAGVAKRTAENAQSKYNSTPLGRVENAANTVKNAITDTFKRASDKVDDATKGVSDSVQAKKEAVEAVSDAFEEYNEIVAKYGANSRLAQNKLSALVSELDSAGGQLLRKYGNAEGTIAGVIEDGQEWIDNLMDQAADVRRRADLYVDTRRNIDQEEGRRRQGRG